MPQAYSASFTLDDVNITFISPYMCLCGSTFKTKRNLQRHIEGFGGAQNPCQVLKKEIKAKLENVENFEGTRFKAMKKKPNHTTSPSESSTSHRSKEKSPVIIGRSRDTPEFASLILSRIDLLDRDYNNNHKSLLDHIHRLENIIREGFSRDIIRQPTINIQNWQQQSSPRYQLSMIPSSIPSQSSRHSIIHENAHDNLKSPDDISSYSPSTSSVDPTSSTMSQMSNTSFTSCKTNTPKNTQGRSSSVSAISFG